MGKSIKDKKVEVNGRSGWILETYKKQYRILFDDNNSLEWHMESEIDFGYVPQAVQEMLFQLNCEQTTLF